MNASLNGYLKSRQLAGNSMGGPAPGMNAGQAPSYANYLSSTGGGQNAPGLLAGKGHAPSKSGKAHQGRSLSDNFTSSKGKLPMNSKSIDTNGGGNNPIATAQNYMQSFMGSGNTHTGASHGRSGAK